MLAWTPGCPWAARVEALPGRGKRLTAALRSALQGEQAEVAARGPGPGAAGRMGGQEAEGGGEPGNGLQAHRGLDHRLQGAGDGPPRGA